MDFMLRVFRLAAILLALHQSLALALIIPYKPSCGPGQRMLQGDNVCLGVSSDGRNISSPNPM